MAFKRLGLLLAVVFCLMPACRTLGGGTRLEQAEELSRKGKYDDAIAVYQAHMKDRLGMKDRPEWENPFFYYLLIGDIELGRARPEEALAAYQEAEKNGIHKSLISDRYRYVASWYEERGQLELALDTLRQHRELDPLLFDAVLDRVARAIIAASDQATPVPTPPK